MDFNTLQAFADRWCREGQSGTAVAIYLHMAEGDLSLDGGSLAHAIGGCYEKLGDLSMPHVIGTGAPPERTPASTSTDATLSG